MAIKNHLDTIRKSFAGSNGYQDLGFGTQNFEKIKRLINQDGSFNVVKKGRARIRSYESYHMLLDMSWSKFFILVLIVYLLINLLFALIYTGIGIEELSGVVGRTSFERFYESFFFSTQTLTTLGYGRISPVGFWAGLAAAVESLLGVLGFALITGLMYGRFSRPKPRLAYSRAVIAPYKGKTAFEFRLANMRSNELIEVEVVVTYTFFDKKENIRTYVNLELERKAVNFMAMNWTVVHPIVEESPFYGMNQEMFYQADGEFIIMIKAFDESFSQIVYARKSYKNHEVVWGGRFNPMYDKLPSGKIGFYLNKIDDLEEVAIDGMISRKQQP